jgi:hypothetical protein
VAGHVADIIILHYIVNKPKTQANTKRKGLSAKYEEVEKIIPTVIHVLQVSQTIALRLTIDTLQMDSIQLHHFSSYSLTCHNRSMPPRLFFLQLQRVGSRILFINFQFFLFSICAVVKSADPNGRAVYCVGLRPLAC